MKAFLSIVMLYALAVLPGFSQNRECIISDRYETEVYDVKPLSKGRWAVAAQHLTYPRALQEEFFSVAIIDSLGRLEKILPVTFQYENEHSGGGPLWTLPNDEIILEYRTGNCDAGYHAFEIEKIDIQGNVLWHQFMSWQQIITGLWLAPDGNYIVALSNDKLGKVSYETGEMIWTYELPYFYPSSFLLVPGTEDFIVGDSIGLSYYEHHEDTSGVSYILSHSKDMELDSGGIYLRGIDEGGNFYGVKSIVNELYRFDLDFNLEFITNFPTSLVYILQDHLLIREATKIKIYDLDGNFVSEKKFNLEDGVVKDFYSTTTGLAVIGDYFSGPTPDLFPGYTYYGREQGWFRFFPKYNLADASNKFSMAVTDIKELEAVKVDSFYSLGPDYEGYLYDLEDGKFNIRVTNTGTDTVHSFSINIIFGEITNFWFCPPISAVSEFYDNNEIAPAESIWVEFEGLTAYRQKQNPSKFCFWTSQINNRPDDIPEDDRYCFDRLVKTDLLTDEKISMYPNPADDEVNILNLPESNSKSTWVLFDTVGRSKKAGLINEGKQKLTINTKDLAPGIYFIQIGKLNNRLVVQH
ncbi:MAG TPA: T9SS type A sorting domain-containing protein [Saprospiraceae bacterium]|nr:T9SS type A sorting domain-containing protein [Saprospiraceae bacterium]